MNFDDFNYNAYNKHVLVKPPIEPIDQLRELEARLKIQTSVPAQPTDGDQV
jgi:hypothetical protein